MKDRNLKSKVLVLGADERSGLAIIRSLGRGNIEVHVASHRQEIIARHSRYLTAFHSISPFSLHQTAWKTQLSRIMAEKKFDLVIPTNDMWVTAIQQNCLELERFGKFYTIKKNDFQILYNKLKTNELARSSGIPTPVEVVITGEKDISTAIRALWFSYSP